MMHSKVLIQYASRKEYHKTRFNSAQIDEGR